ncbi:MAG: NAD(P)H-dependent glycerol-3-phosphate dehydrogenase [Candidatus Scatovivens sp.]
MKNIAIIGSGSWGIALGIYLAKRGNNINIWSFDENEKKEINEQRKSRYLPNIVIPNKIKCYSDFENVIIGSDIILHVTPSKFARETIKQYKKYVDRKQIIVMCSKGFEKDTLLSLGDVVKQEIPDIKYAALSGPSHAEEVCVDIPTAIVVASEYKDVNEEIINLFRSNSMKIYATDDVKGVELGGTLKNIIAFCAGIIISLGYGDNTYAALLTRGLAEIKRLGMAIGARESTFYGLTGLGDLIVTCGSMHSRNRRAGQLVGKGLSIEETKKEIGMTIESIDNIEVAYKLKEKYNVEMPIVESVYNVLYNNLNVKEAVNQLMSRTTIFE